MKELYKYIGRKALVTVGTMKFEVVIDDVLMAYGKVRFTVIPVNGVGKANVEQSGLELIGE